ncbi:UMP kinase [Buchnera aphidicola]|uniref:UMP kinase n=1 Tax=Buchnera aphidicola TaxID=9 RepID=UPI003464B03E
MANCMKFIYKRILLKMSGEVIKGVDKVNFKNCLIYNIVKEIRFLVKNGIEISLVIGGGNLFRGSFLSKLGINRVSSDYIGMLSTIINGLFLKDIFERYNIPVCLMSSITIDNVCKKYNLEKAMKLLSNSVVIIFCGGMGNPFFTTDSAACVRAIETNSDIIFKGTKVNGIYSQDPNKYPDAFFYKKLNYQDVLQKEFKVMDLTAFILARDYNIPVHIFNIYHNNILSRILQGNTEGTLITS